jgi:uncharacterized protein (TIGR03083 family)
MPMADTGDERFFAELRDCTAELAQLVDGDLDRPVPTCPGWTFRQLATHLGRGHRWAARIVATRATGPVPTREVPDGKLPADPAEHGPWLNASADLVAEAVTAAGGDQAWTFIGMRPASFWARRRAHEAAVHLADAQLAVGQEVDLTADVAADAVDEWLGMGLSGTGEWLVTRTPSGVSVDPGHTKADVAVRGPAVGLLLVLTRRLPSAPLPAAVGVEVLGDRALLDHWLENTPF